MDTNTADDDGYEYGYSHESNRDGKPRDLQSRGWIVASLESLVLPPHVVEYYLLAD